MATEGPQALRASQGEMTFADDVDAPMRETIREMWVNRLAGFGEQDLARYLRDNVSESRFVVYGKTWSFSAFRRFNRVLFLIRRVCAPFGITVEAEAVDVRVTREGTGYLAHGWLVLSLCGRVFRQSRLTMPIIRRSDRWVWDRIVDNRAQRTDWRYALRKDRRGLLELSMVDSD